MKVLNCQMQLQATSMHKQEHVKQEHLNVWIDSAPKPTTPKDTVCISAEGLNAQPKPLEAKEEDMLADQDYLKLKMLEKMLTHLSGRQFQFRYVAVELQKTQQDTAPSLPENPPPQSTQTDARAGWGLHYQYREQFTEQEQLAFAAEGAVQLADGRQVAFSVSLHMNRSFSQTFSLDIKAGDALKDPLVLDLDGQGISFSEQTMQFDLDFDGRTDAIPIAGKGNGYLVLDRNNNHFLDDGSELFGPKTGHGFHELASYDDDPNNWIDEGDAIFASLKIWVSDGAGAGRLIGISEAGIGAIFLGNAKSSFQYKDAENNTLGQLKQTGIFLHEDGHAGIMQEVDLRV